MQIALLDDFQSVARGFADSTKLGAAAAVDVFDINPLAAADPTRSILNPLLTPHVSHVIRETCQIYYTGIVETIAAFIEGKPIRVITP